MGVLPEFHHNMYINSNFPPQIHHYPHGGVAHITAVPPLDHRRNSCSSADSVAAPQTPSLGSTCADSATPSIEGEFQHGMPFSPMEAPGQKKVPGQVRYPTDYTRNSLYNPSKTSNVYVRGLVPETNDETLLKLVQPYGTVAQHKAIINKETGFCKGYGFARFETIDEAKSCILSMAKYNLDAGFARESFNSRLKSLRDPSSTNLYVSNLPPSVDEAKMKEIFKDFWVNSARILRDAQGVSRGVGFVRLGNHDVCNQVIEMFNDRVVVEGEPAIQVRYADTHAQKNLKETTARVREFYCNEQKKVLGKVPAQVKGVPMGPRNDGGKRWAGGRKIIS